MSTEEETQKKTWRDSLSIDMLLSALSVLVVAQPSTEAPEGLMNCPVLTPVASLALPYFPILSNKGHDFRQF